MMYLKAEIFVQKKKMYCGVHRSSVLAPLALSSVKKKAKWNQHLQ
jgi:hypothetical protein